MTQRYLEDFAVGQIFHLGEEIARDTIFRGPAAKELGSEVAVIKADMSDVEAAERAIATVVEKFGNLDIVFASTEIAGSTPVGRTDLAAFEEVLKTNLIGVFSRGPH